LNEEGKAFYDGVIDALIELNITPGVEIQASAKDLCGSQHF
jgi:hypothetical protein